LFARLPHRKTPFWSFGFLLLNGTTERGALKANILPGRPTRLAVGAVKGAQFAFIEAKRKNPDWRGGRLGRRLSAGRAKQSG
jgi:hypothetical protein